jgi:hypothetical protein
MMQAEFKEKSIISKTRLIEQKDVSTEFPNVAARLKKKLLEINAGVMDDVPEWQ